MSNQSFGFSSSHVQTWELDHEGGWALKNWCFQTVVLERTLESPLDCKEIKPVHPKGDQSWIFLGRTDLKLKLQYFGHLIQRSDLLKKTLMLGKIEGGRRRGQQRLRWLDGIINSMERNLSKLWETVKDRGTWCVAVHGIAKSQTWLRDRTTATGYEKVLTSWTPFSPKEDRDELWDSGEAGREWTVLIVSWSSCFRTGKSSRLFWVCLRNSMCQVLESNLLWITNSPHLLFSLTQKSFVFYNLRCLVTVSSWRKGGGTLWGLFYLDINPILGAPPLWPHHPQRHLLTPDLVGQDSTHEFEGDTEFSPQQEI